MRALTVALLLFTVTAASAQQQLYRWTDETGRVHITDTPPPASARDVQRKSPGATSAGEPQLSFEVMQAAREYPVTLYTAGDCAAPCAAARALLKRRGVPFKEVQVSDAQSLQELKRASGASDVPTLLVGRSVHRGYEAGAYDALLDSARYPKAHK